MASGEEDHATLGVNRGLQGSSDYFEFWASPVLFSQNSSNGPPPTNYHRYMNLNFEIYIVDRHKSQNSNLFNDDK